MDTTEIKRTLATNEQRFFHFLARCATASPWTIILCSVLLAAGAVFYTFHHLEFVTGRNDLISSDKRYIQLDDEYSQEFMEIGRAHV